MRQAKPGEKAARWIRVDGTVTHVVPDNGTDFTLEECYDLIKTNDSVRPMLEVAPIYGGKNKGRIVLCHEEGWISDLPPNKTATLALADSGIMTSPEGFRGDIVICEADMIR